MHERNTKAYNTNRKIQRNLSPEYCAELAKKVGYGGNPEHKRNPGNFGLSPPSSHLKNPTKALCDTVNITTRKNALKNLKAGVKKGLISKQTRGEEPHDYPQNIWSVLEDGTVLEAQLENSGLGTYHGYPLPEADPFVKVVRKHWEEMS